MQTKFGPISVTCTAAGTGVPSWSRSDEPVFRYTVVVTDGHAKYQSAAWGSIADFAKNKHDFEGIAAMVVDELLSAHADPQEFKEMVVGKKTGFERTRALGVAKRVCDAAKKFSYDDLTKAVDVAEERGLR